MQTPRTVLSDLFVIPVQPAPMTVVPWEGRAFSSVLPQQRASLRGGGAHWDGPTAWYCVGAARIARFPVTCFCLLSWSGGGGRGYFKEHRNWK